MSGSTYYGNVNLDLLAWTPLAASRVLELGCGEGAFAAAYKMRNPTVEYIAIEAYEPAAAVARSRVDELIVADFMTMSDDDVVQLGRFDVIVMGDVLEHLSDPWKALRRLRGLLNEGGRLSISVPNVSHWSALANLITGNWPAEPAGLFDRTHLRFFTLNSLEAVLRETGFELERARSRKIIGDVQAAQAWIPLLAAVAEQRGVDKNAFLTRAQTLQYVATARSSDSGPDPRLHLHIAALAPAFLTARTGVPAAALASDPTITVTYQEQTTQLPLAPQAEAKVAVLQRLVPNDRAGWLAYVRQARARNWTLVYELDDHPDLIGQVLRDRHMADLLDLAVTGCHAVQTSTPALAEVLRRSNPEVAVFENAILDLPPFKARDRARRVFYGALNREAFSAKVAAALGAAVAENPELEFVVVHDRAFFDALPTSKKVFRAALAYPQYLAEMAECDIVLSPLEGSAAEAFKSDLKYLEAARSGAAFIGSPCIYEQVTGGGRTGLIARSIADWSTCLSRLAANPDLRNAVAQAAWRDVRDGRMMGAQVPARRAWYMDICRRRSELDAALLARSPELQADPAT